MTNRTTSTKPLHKWPLTLIAGLALAGLSIGAYLAIMKLRLEFDINYKPSCDVGQGVSCSVNQQSEYSTAFGLPIAVWSIPTYLLLLYMSLYSLIKRVELGAGRRRARAACEAIFVVSFLSFCYSLYLAYVSKFVLESLCPWCIGLYAVNLFICLLAFLALGRPLGQLMSDLANRVKSLQPVPQAGLIFGLSLLAAVLWHDRMKSQIKADAAEEQHRLELLQKQQIDAQFVQKTVKNDNAVVDGPKPKMGDLKNQPVANHQAKPPVTKTVRAKKPTPVRTELGLTFYEAPVSEQDFAWGDPDAPVTIVEFADFQCSFCRILSLNMRTVKKKYADKVRVVFKHYPMDGSCNPRMGGNRMHENACDAAKAAHCAGVQGKFWEMHDLLYDDQKNLAMPDLQARATKLNLDLAQWNACLSSPATLQKIRADIQSAARAGITGTPRMYINGRLLSGAASPSILGYMIDKSAEASAAQEAQKVQATKQTPSQISITSGASPFFIDTFEATLDKGGSARSVPSSTPAQVSWFEAKSACEKAGKRLCTEQEWVTACAGQAAVDNNNNGFFADDDVEGRMFPYGDFYEKGRCRDSEDKYKGTAGATGSLAGCRTSSGVYDLAGNVSEWVGDSERKASLVGGDYRSGSRASCNKRSSMYGPGYRNKTTGFRCCSDQAKQTKSAQVELDLSSTEDVLGKPVGNNFKAILEDGTVITNKWFLGKTTYLTFFASWCGSCKRELPALNQLQTEFKDRGFHVLAIGTDRIKDRSLSFAKKYKPIYTIALDPDSSAMGLLKIDAMPASFIVDSNGIVQHRTIGFRPEDLPGIKQRVEKALSP